MTDTQETAVCPCESPTHPRRVSTPAGRSALDRRVGDFVSFRHALLRAQPGETALSDWRPSAEDDLGVQMVEWWAYLADILTFYDERIADESYLNTASLPENVRAIIRLLGYRPRPGIGATAFVGALQTDPPPPAGVTIPAGFAIQSKPGPGQEPQIFETAAAQPLIAPDGSLPGTPPAAASADSDLIAVRPSPVNTKLTEDKASVTMQGSVAVQVGEKLLIVKRNWDGSAGYAAYAQVKAVSVLRDPDNRPMTRVTFDGLAGITEKDAKAADYRIMRSDRITHLYQYAKLDNAFHAAKPGWAHLATLSRDIALGDPIYIENGTAAACAVVLVSGYSEDIWYVNAAGAPDSTTPGSSPGTGAVPAPHTVIYASIGLPACDKSTTFHYAFAEIGTLIPAPDSRLAPPASGVKVKLTATGGKAPALQPGRTVLVQDARGVGAVGVVAPDGSVELTPPFPVLTLPLVVIPNALPVSRGKTVASEVLGSGIAGIGGQTFTLQKSPLTYLFDATAPDKYRSTLLIRVNGTAWTEVASFLDQGPNDRVFTTFEDDDQKTHVQFGDGVHGARLPTGQNNVVATYRYGSGAAVPDVGALTNIVNPVPGLKSLKNPVQAGGGSDPDPSERIRQFAPRSVLTFGRAVSADDYEIVAAQTPGVIRARAYWLFREETQRAGISLFIGDDAAAVAAVRQALAGAADPNRLAEVKLAVKVPIQLTLKLLVDPARDPDTVGKSVALALSDTDTGLFGTKALRIGEPLFRSRLHAVCLSMPGVIAVRESIFVAPDAKSPTGIAEQKGFRFDPGNGKYYGFDDIAKDLKITMEKA